MRFWGLREGIRGIYSFLKREPKEAKIYSFQGVWVPLRWSCRMGIIKYYGEKLRF